MKTKKTKNLGKGMGPSKAAIAATEVFAVSPAKLKEFIAITAQYRGLVEHRDGLGELYKGCEAWRRRQKDLDRNAWKNFMVKCSARVFKEELLKIDRTLGEINAKIKALGVVSPPDPGGEKKSA